MEANCEANPFAIGGGGEKVQSDRVERRVGKAERRLDEVEEGQRIEVPSEAERGQQLEQCGEKRAGTEGSQIEADEVSGQRQHLR